MHGDLSQKRLEDARSRTSDHDDDEKCRNEKTDQNQDRGFRENVRKVVIAGRGRTPLVHGAEKAGAPCEVAAGKIRPHEPVVFPEGLVNEPEGEHHQQTHHDPTISDEC